MIKIVSFKICPFVQRVTAMLEAKNVPYDVEYIQLSAKPDWFLDLSPTAQVPLLVTETGVALFESDAIVEYIDEITAPLQNDLTPEQRAIQRAWSYQASKHYLVQCATLQSADQCAFQDRMSKLGKAFERAEARLGDGPYFSGTELGNVDIAWLPLLHRAALVEQHSGHDMLTAYPRVKAWQAALMATGLAERSVPQDFDARFADLYLSDRTWLGRGANLNEAPSGTLKAAGGGCCG
ncbi:glutathione S-transferase family protein [Tropicimonas sp. TH_r6]|uniref:glutathione S-transferase family protein n=1 Tax=Tropicimonas sp. TH_r6 TaxID=3082085 RepID=UPI0029542D9C|nr:glutathione S-transferase family protein [Tropicimonas sp. TH_r6]MDV7141590.1 glutathione S-transferase family protein [Tropicimonas sp. TH_r6]